MIKFEKPILNIVNIELSKIKLPPPLDNISDDCNTLSYSFENDPNCYNIILKNGLYNIDDILTAIQTKFNENNHNITIMKNKSNHIIIKNLDNENINIENGSSKLIDLLGFLNDSYTRKSSYKSERLHKFNTSNTVYLFLENIINDKPFAKIDLSNQKEFKPIKYTLDLISTLSDFIVKFKTTDDPNRESLYDFNGRPHKLKLKIGYFN